MNRPIPEYLITGHARDEMTRRKLSPERVHAVLAAPEQRWQVRRDRDVLQSRFFMDTPRKRYLVRVFVDVDREPPEVVTAYRTGKITKYWREEV